MMKQMWKRELSNLILMRFGNLEGRRRRLKRCRPVQLANGGTPDQSRARDKTKSKVAGWATLMTMTVMMNRHPLCGHPKNKLCKRSDRCNITRRNLVVQGQRQHRRDRPSCLQRQRLVLKQLGGLQLRPRRLILLLRHDEVVILIEMDKQEQGLSTTSRPKMMQ